MPILQTVTKNKRLVLPTTENLPEADQAWVVMDVSPYITRDVSGVRELESETTAGINMVSNRIKEWNYTDAEGKPLPITFSNVELLDIEDFKFLQAQVEKGSLLTDDEKKASSDTSLPGETTAVTQAMPQANT